MKKPWVSILNPEHLFEQALQLVAAPAAGAPRQSDIRRAISAAYYGVFHFVLTALADEVVGSTKRGTSRYELVYRSLDHRRLKDLCSEVAKPTLPPKYRPYEPSIGFGSNIPGFATAIIELQDKRHRADYSQIMRFRASDARAAVATARSAIRQFNRANAQRRKTFLILLLCPPR